MCDTVGSAADQAMHAEQCKVEPVLVPNDIFHDHHARVHSIQNRQSLPQIPDTVGCLAINQLLE